MEKFEKATLGTWNPADGVILYLEQTGRKTWRVGQVVTGADLGSRAFRNLDAAWRQMWILKEEWVQVGGGGYYNVRRGLRLSGLEYFRTSDFGN
jgi:hypothetical protein